VSATEESSWRKGERRWLTKRDTKGRRKRSAVFVKKEEDGRCVDRHMVAYGQKKEKENGIRTEEEDDKLAEKERGEEEQGISGKFRANPEFLEEK